MMPKTDDEWWVEQRAYDKELTLRKDGYAVAKGMLEEVLDYYGLEPSFMPLPSTGWAKVRCPFHDDKNPSASSSEFYFRCHACGVHGDSIGLVMSEENLDFLDAVRFILQLEEDDD